MARRPIASVRWTSRFDSRQISPPPLVDPRTFDAIQERLRLSQLQAIRNNREPEATLLRGGFARCGYCGLTMFARRRKHGWEYACRTGWGYRAACMTPTIAARGLDAAVWERVEALLTRPEIVAAELERMQASDPTADDLATIDKALTEVGRQQRNLLDQLANLGEVVAALVNEKLITMEKQQRELAAEREAVLSRRQTWLAAQDRLGELETWCRMVAANLGKLTYQDKRLALDALGVQARVWRTDHTPRYEIETNIPLDEAIMDSTARGSSRGRR